jgi:hypothetical protein
MQIKYLISAIALIFIMIIGLLGVFKKSRLLLLIVSTQFYLYLFKKEEEKKKKKEEDKVENRKTLTFVCLSLI